MYELAIWGDSDGGPARPRNEDHFYFAQHPAAPGQGGGLRVPPQLLAERGYLLAVADGVAGEVGGAEASRRILAALVDSYYSRQEENLAEALALAVQEANRRLLQQSGGRGATTLVAAVIQGEHLYLANVGDSRAYLLRRGRARRLSNDHATDGGALLRVLGQEEEVRPDFYRPLLLQPGDRVLLCSDGLYRPLTGSKALVRLAGQGAPQEAVPLLLQAALQADGSDNATAVLALVTRPATLPLGLAPWQWAVWALLLLSAVLLAGWLALLLLGNGAAALGPPLVMLSL